MKKSIFLVVFLIFLSNWDNGQEKEKQQQGQNVEREEFEEGDFLLNEEFEQVTKPVEKPTRHEVEALEEDIVDVGKPKPIRDTPAKKKEFDEFDEELMSGEHLVQDEFEGVPKKSEEFTEGEKLIEDEFGSVTLPTTQEEKEIREGNKLVEDTFSEEVDLKTYLFDLEGLLRKKYLPDTMDLFRVSSYYRAQYFVQKLPHNKRDFQHEMTVRLELSPKLGPVEIVAISELNIDDFDAARGFYTLRHLEDNGEHRSLLTFSEAYAKMQLGPLDLSIGKRIYAWGAAFGPNPTDVLNSYDLIDPIEGYNISNDRKIGAWSFFAKLYLAHMLRDWEIWKTIEFPAIEVIFIPRFTRNRVPLPNSRWYVDSTLALRQELANQLGLTPESVTLLVEHGLPAHTLENSQWAIKTSATVKGWDISVSYYQGVSSFAGKKLDITNAPVIRVVDFYDNVHILGSDFVTTFGPFRVFFEGIHSWSKTRDQDDYFNVIFGGGRYYTPVLFDADKFDFTVEVFFNHLVTRKPDNSSVLPYPKESGNRGVVLSVTYNYDQSWSMNHILSLNLDRSYRWASYFYSFQLSYKVHPNLIFSLRTQWINGTNQDIVYGSYKDNDNLFGVIDYTF